MTDPMTEAAGGQVAAGEPVAWRTEYRDVYKGHDTGWHFRYHTDEPTPGPLVNGCGHKNVVPLYATRPSPSRDALVEALQWYGDQMCEGMCEGCDADAVFSSDRCAGCPARQALAATIPADDGAGEAVKLAFTWAYARGFQVADETSRSCIGSIDDAWQDYLAALRPTGEEKP